MGLKIGTETTEDTSLVCLNLKSALKKDVRVRGSSLLPAASMRETMVLVRV